MTDQPQHPLQGIDSASLYKEALQRVWNELQDLKEQKKEIALREAQLNETMKALMPLTGVYKPNISEYSLSNAVRFIFNGLAPGRSLSAMDVRTKLEDLGYDLSGHENALASIHTAMRRMIESEELTPVKTEDNKKKFEAGPELKSVPEPTPIPDLETISTVLGLGVPTKGEK